LKIFNKIKEHWLGQVIALAFACISCTYIVINVIIINPKNDEIKRLEKIIDSLKEERNKVGIKLPNIQNNSFPSEPLITPTPIFEIDNLEPGIYLKRNAKRGEKLSANNLLMVKIEELKNETYNDRPQNINDIINLCLDRNVSSKRHLTWHDIAIKCN
jgi:flagella basal body P-ring formation protein FlgA